MALPSEEINQYVAQHPQRLLKTSRHIEAEAAGRSQSTMHLIPRKSVPRGSVYLQVAANEVLGLNELNEPQKSAKTRSAPYTELSCLSVWWEEILACLVMVAAFAAIVVTLHLVNDKTLPRLLFHVSVNTLVATFAAILKLSAALVLDAGLSQHKWSWFTRPRRLHDFQVYDNASRGPWGALQLLYPLRFYPSIASLGALIAITAIVIDPLSQELIKIYDCTETLPNETCSLPRTQFFNELGLHIGPARNQISAGLMGSLATGQFSLSPPQVAINCPTGNCTFKDEYSSVGYCSTCVDLTDRITFKNCSEDTRNMTIRLPSFRAGEPDLLFFNATISGSTARSIRFAMNFDPIDGNVNMLWWDADMFPESGNPRQAHAAQCSLDHCIHTFRAEVTNGILSEETLQRGPNFDDATFIYTASSIMQFTGSMADLSCTGDTVRENLRDVGYNFTADVRWLPYKVVIDPIFPESDTRHYAGSTDIPKVVTERGLETGFYSGNSSTHTLSDAGLRIVPSRCVYQIYEFIVISLNEVFFEEYFADETIRDNVYDDAGTESAFIPTAFYKTGAIDHKQNGTFENIQNMIQNMTDSMTTYIRSEPVIGTVLRNTVCVRVVWPYIAQSASIVALLLLFFIGTIFHTRITERASSSLSRAEDFGRAQIVRHHDFISSALATIFHGLDQRSLYEPGYVGSSNNVSELERFSKDCLVTLVHTQHGWKLSTVER